MIRGSAWNRTRKRLFEIVEVGSATDKISRGYDLLYVLVIIANLAATIAFTFNSMEAKYGPHLEMAEDITVIFFVIDYVLRILSAPCKFPTFGSTRATLKYVFSFMGLIDLISFLPNFLPWFFPSGVVAFRMFRMVRIFRLFRINAYYDSLSVITEVLESKKQQLLSSVFIIIVMMIFSSMCLYSIENKAQPDVFENAFSGIWWASSALLTVGYGDIYPITPLGKFFGLLITFLGVGVVAIPTGIISAGFVDQYSRIKRMSDYGKEEAVHFIRVTVSDGDGFAGKKLNEVNLPKSVIVAAVNRDDKVIVPRGDTVIKEGDVLVFGAESLGDDRLIELKELEIKANHPWAGEMIKELDISRQTIIVLIHRGKDTIIPKGSTKLQEGDTVLMYTQSHIPDSTVIQI